jgi:nucleoside phosphorylase
VQAADFFACLEPRLLAFRVTGLLCLDLCPAPVLQKVSMPLVYVFAALKMEAAPLRKMGRKGASGEDARGSFIEKGANRFVILVTGMGRKNARIKADAALGLAPPHAPRRSASQKPDAVLAIGLCGGLTKELKEGHVVAYTECLSDDGLPPLECSPRLTNAITDELLRQGIPCDRVSGISSARIVSTRSRKIELARSGASAVDMESYEVVSAAAHAGVPAAVLRVVCDSLDAEIPDFNPALDNDGELARGKKVWIAVTSPCKTLHLLAATHRGMRQLTATTRILLHSDCFSNGQDPIR